jgi:hypothetical protein
MPTAGRLVATCTSGTKRATGQVRRRCCIRTPDWTCPPLGEHLVGREQVIALQERYPEPWGDLEVLRVLNDMTSASAVAEIEIVAPTAVFPLRGILGVQGHQLCRGVEYWVTVGGEKLHPADRGRRLR